VQERLPFFPRRRYMPNHEAEFLTIPQAARYSGISEAGLRSRIRSGTLVAERVGPYGNILIPRAALDALLLLGGPGSPA
jgi:excisionase family DNA binding protein